MDRSRPLPRLVALVVLTTVLVGCGRSGATSSESTAGSTVDESGAATTSRSTPADPGAPSPVEPSDGTLSAESDALVGGVVDGFPLDLLPLPPDAEILVTSAVPIGSDGVHEVSLNLRTTASASAVLELYRGTLIAAGFTEVPARATELAAESTFTRSGGDELISLGVLDTDGRRTVTVGGRVRLADVGSSTTAAP